MKFHVEDAEKAPVLMDLVRDHLCYRILILLGFLAFFAQGLHYILFTLYILAQSCIKLKSFSSLVTQRHNNYKLPSVNHTTEYYYYARLCRQPEFKDQIALRSA